MGVTIKDIAKKAKVSVSTVSRVLNNKPDVNESTRKRVQAIVKELNYNPNSIARGLVTNKTYTIGLIIPDISNPFFPELAKGIDDYAKAHNYSVIIYNTGVDSKEEEKAVDVLRGKQVDGLIAALSIANRDKMDYLYESNYPLVQIVRNTGSLYPSVDVDGVKSAYQAVEYLYNKGHRSIAHITGSLDSAAGKCLYQGFKSFIDKHIPNYNWEWVVEGRYTKESGYRQMKSLLEKKPIPTAVFTGNDLMAIGVYKAIKEKGLKIPDDISVVGHDNIELSSYISPALTTMSFSKHYLGQSAAKLLIQQIESDNNKGLKDIIVESELIIRSSVRDI